MCGVAVGLEEDVGRMWVCGCTGAILGMPSVVLLCFLPGACVLVPVAGFFVIYCLLFFLCCLQRVFQQATGNRQQAASNKREKKKQRTRNST